mmetsp:Transcript_42950/g.129734  ORF Transcript_42950/g.129734 Transcript_42950/m.129734 type:complete len:225 (+) Transcript_42950:360-1034(+)
MVIVLQPQLSGAHVGHVRHVHRRLWLGRRRVLVDRPESPHGRRHRHSLSPPPVGPDPPNLSLGPLGEEVVRLGVRFHARRRGHILGHRADGVRPVRLRHRAGPHRGPHSGGRGRRRRAPDALRHAARGHVHVVRARREAEPEGVPGGHHGAAAADGLLVLLYHLRELRHDRLAHWRHQRGNVREERRQARGGAPGAAVHGQGSGACGRRNLRFRRRPTGRGEQG